MPRLWSSKASTPSESDPLLADTLQVDETVLDEKLVNDPDAVRRLFAFDFAAGRVTKHGDGTVPILSAAVKGVTLAAFDQVAEHALLCSEDRVIDLTSLWLEGKQALKMTRRSPQDNAQRRTRRYFQAWDGDPTSFSKHIV